MYTTGTLGNNLQGVSQQPDEIRVTGKVTEQINFFPDVVEGLTSPPATRLLKRNLVPAGSNYRFLDIPVDGGRYILGYHKTSFRIWDSLGQEQTVTQKNNFSRYLGPDMRAYVFDGDVYLVNRDRVVAKSAVTGLGQVLTGTAYVTLLGGLYARQYSIRIRYRDGSAAEGRYETPTGETTGDAKKTRASSIATALLTSIKSHAKFKSGTIAAQSDTVLYFRHPDIVSLVVSDDDANKTIRGFAGSLRDITQLPKTAAHGSFVKARGERTPTDILTAVRQVAPIDAPPPLKLGQHTLSELIDRWYQSSQFRRLRQSSASNYEYAAERLRTIYGHLPAETLTRRDIIMLMQKKTHAPASANLDLQVLRLMYDYAVQVGEWVDVNPARLVKNMSLRKKRAVSTLGQMPRSYSTSYTGRKVQPQTLPCTLCCIPARRALMPGNSAPVICVARPVTVA